MLIVRRPIRIGNTKGRDDLRGAATVLPARGCLVLEQLVHTCVSTRRATGAARAHHLPRVHDGARWRLHALAGAEVDTPFLISAIALLLVALLPPPRSRSRPLCSPPTLGGAAERVVRAFLIACVYVVLVYAAAPISSTLADTLVCIMRSATASAWILVATMFSLPLAVIQVAVVLYCSFNASNAEYEGLSLRADPESGAELLRGVMVASGGAEEPPAPSPPPTAMGIAQSVAAAPPPLARAHRLRQDHREDIVESRAHADTSQPQRLQPHVQPQHRATTRRRGEQRRAGEGAWRQTPIASIGRGRGENKKA